MFLPLLTHTFESLRGFVRMRKSDGDTQVCILIVIES